MNCVRFNVDESNVIISGSIDGKCKLWDVRSRAYEHVQELDDCRDSVTHIDISKHQLLVSCLDKRVRVYDLRFGKMTSDYVGEQVTCSTFSGDEQCVLVSVLRSALLLMDRASGEMLNEFSGHVNRTYAIANCMNRESSEVITGSEDGNVYIYDLVEATCKQKLPHANDKTVHSLSYHPAEARLLSAQEQSVYLWS